LLIDASQMLTAPAAVLIAGNQALFITAAGSVVHAFDQERGLFYPAGDLLQRETHHTDPMLPFDATDLLL